MRLVCRSVPPFLLTCKEAYAAARRLYPHWFDQGKYNTSTWKSTTGFDIFDLLTSNHFSCDWGEIFKSDLLMSGVEKLAVNVNCWYECLGRAGAQGELQLPLKVLILLVEEDGATGEA